MSNETREKAQQLHQQCFVFDGLTYLCDGTVTELAAGGVNATNITVPSFEDDWPETCQNISHWLERCAADDSPWVLIESTADFDRTGHDGSVGIVMGWQNMRPISDSLDRIGFFHKLGVRIMQPTYNYRNMMGNGCLEPSDEGLSQLGRDAVRIMNELGIAIDLSMLASAQPATSLKRVSNPCWSPTPTPMRLRHYHAISRTRSSRRWRKKAASSDHRSLDRCYGMGNRINPPPLMTTLRMSSTSSSWRGIEHVGFGTDFPAVSDQWKIHAGPPSPRTWDAIVNYGEVFGESIAATFPEGIDTQADFPVITAALLRRGWSPDDVKAYLGENFRRVLGKIWGQ